jgi:hypothetical protein
MDATLDATLRDSRAGRPAAKLGHPAMLRRGGLKRSARCDNLTGCNSLPLIRSGLSGALDDIDLRLNKNTDDDDEPAPKRLAHFRLVMELLKTDVAR